MNSAGPVLVHARGRQTPDECSFWNRLDAALRDHGSSLTVIAHHHPQSSVSFDMRRIPNGLDNAPDFKVPPDPIGSNTLEKFLDREHFWHGPARDASHLDQRRDAIAFFHATYTEWLDEWRPSLAVIWNGHHPQEMILAQLCHERGISLCWIERGPLPRTLHFDRQGILGGSTIAQQSTWSWSNTKDEHHWRNVLSQFRESLGSATWWPQPSIIGASRLRQQHAITSGCTAVCFAGQVDRDVQNLLHSPLFQTNADAFAWLCRALPADLFILGKHHPMSDTPPEAYESVLTGRRGTWITDAAITDCISACDRFAAVNSTSLFEAMLAGKPALSLGRSLLSGKDITYEVTNLESAGETLQNWLAARDWDSRHDRFNDFCAYLLAHHLYATEESDEQPGLRGTNALAQTLVRWGSRTTTGWTCASTYS